MVRHYIEVDSGVELFVEDSGKGKPLVFIPGFTFTTDSFEKQVAHFSKTHRVIVVDPRSHGRSTKTVHGNDYVTHGTDLVKVLKHLDLQDVVLVGWSFGCLTAWEYFKQNGTERIKSVVLVDMPPKSLSVHADDWVEGALDDIAGIYTSSLRSPEGQREFIKAYITGVMIQRELSEAELTALVDQSMNTPYYIAANLFGSGMFSDYREAAKQMSEALPSLTVVAEHWAETATRYMKDLTPKTKLATLGGHMMFWEHAEKFNEILASFIKENE